MRPLGIITTALVALAVLTSALPLHRCTPAGGEGAVTLLVGGHAHDDHGCDHRHESVSLHRERDTHECDGCGTGDRCCVDGAHDVFSVPAGRASFPKACAQPATVAPQWMATNLVPPERLVVRLLVDADRPVPRASPVRTEVLLI